jgi:DNA-binding SARP family transcriptional activator
MTNGQQDSPGPSAVGETDPSTAELLVHTLGPPKVEYAGQPLAIPRRQTRALLYRLAARLEPVGRERLAFLFWPDKPDATARRNLSQLLSLLRHALPHRDWLLTSRSHVRLDREFVWSDAAAFEALCGARDAYDRIEKLKQAVSLYRGPFLSGVTLSGSPEYEAWMSETRYTLEHLYLEALKTLIDAEGAQGAYDAAITHALDYLAVDELAEDVHRQLVELYASGGDRDAALRQYETCAAILERELGVDPLPETRAVYEAVRAGEILPAPPVTAPTWTTLPSLYAPLVGRDAALRRLRTARRRAQASQGGIVLISGEAGVGKSRLLQEFASLHGEAVVLAGGGYADTQAIPYHPIVEALRSAPDLYALASHLQPVWLAEAARLLPELHTRYTDLPPPQEAEPEQARGRLFEALNRLILEPAAAQPVLLCLDDLHWADATTLEWLAQLGRRLTRRSHSSRLLVLGTFRSEEAGTVRDLRHSLTRLDRGAVLELRPLDVAAVRQLLRHLAGPSAAGDVATRRLHHVTGGNPYFLLELLRVLVESGQSLSNLTDLETFPLPDSIREAVLVRLDRLSPVARQVLEAGAVLGPIFEFQVVHRTTGRGELEALEGLDELLGRQVLLEQAVPEQALPGHPQHYRFQHELLRSAIYETLSYGRRQLLHRRAGEALEARLPRRRGLPSERPDGELVARLAHHFTEAGETKKAIDYLLEAGDRARHLNAHEEAIDHYEQALAFLEQQGDDERAARTLMKLGLTYHTAFDFDRSREAYAEGFAIWQRAGTGQPVAPPPAPHALRISGGDPITLDPTFCNYMGSSIILDQLFSGLVALTPEMDVVPDVAASWEVTDGGRKYIFHLRDDVLWSDGVPVTAHDFEFAWQRRLDPTTESPVASFLYDVKGARAFHQGQISDPAVSACGVSTIERW